MNCQEFLNNNFNSHEQCLDFYAHHICNHLMYQQPEIILLVIEKLVASIENLATKECEVYKNHEKDKFYTRQNLLNKNSWLNKKISQDRVLNQNTSGSTTGEPFHYFNDSKYFDFVQRNCEFDLILKEYDLYEKPLKILNLFKHPYNPKPEGFSISLGNYSQNKFHSYGAKESTIVFVNWDTYIYNPDEWHEQLFEMLLNSDFDITLASGPVVNIICRYVKKHNFKKHFTNLLSHTTEFPRISDFQFLKYNKNITYYCDHMKGWDGGCSFFTCKHGTYHLNDNFALSFQGPNNKLISTDYFNMVSPFINYWNGDLCEIQDEYELCKCGRYYRPFKMLENRPFALKGPTKLTEIKKQIGLLNYKYKINQVQFENLDVNLYLNEKLESEEINSLKEILKDYKVNVYD